MPGARVHVCYMHRMTPSIFLFSVFFPHSYNDSNTDNYNRCWDLEGQMFKKEPSNSCRKINLTNLSFTSPFKQVKIRQKLQKTGKKQKGEFKILLLLFFQPLTMYLTVYVCFYHSTHLHNANKWYINNSVFSRAFFHPQQLQRVFEVPRLKNTPQNHTLQKHSLFK